MAHRLPQGTVNTAATTERWDVAELRVRENSVVVIDALVRDGSSTSERRERILTDTKVAALWDTAAKQTFAAWVALIHQNSSVRK